MNRVLTLMLLATAVAACGDTLPRTQVMLVLDAEPGVRMDTTDVHVLVRGGTGAGAQWQQRLDRTLRLDRDVTWPIEIALVPLEGDEGRVYEATATALSSTGDPVARVRAISGYREGKTLELRLLFEDACRAQVEVCDNTETCRSGACTDAQIEVTSLDAYKPSTDAGVDAGGTGGTSGTGGTAGSSGTGGGPCVPASDAPLVDTVDMLFVVDNSGSMKEEQAALRVQFPRMITALLTGVSGDGSSFPAVRDLHLGVVSTDMGLPGVPGRANLGCRDDSIPLGDDGVLRNAPNPGGDPGLTCEPSYPLFLGFTVSQDDAMNAANASALANNVSCIASLGTIGCGFEQPLEATLRALWPSDNIVPGDMPGPNAFRDGRPFIDNTMFGKGDPAGSNAGFARNEVSQGLSVLAVVLVTDEEDCSSHNMGHFVPENFLQSNDPLKTVGLNLRCYNEAQRLGFHPQGENARDNGQANLYATTRYVQALKALRPGNENLVVFAGIVGLPTDLADARANVDFTSSSARTAYYDSLLSDQRLQEFPDPNTLTGNPNLIPSCLRNVPGNDVPQKAFPPRRIIKVAKELGENSVVGSICTDDFTSAINNIVGTIANQLGQPICGATGGGGEGGTGGISGSGGSGGGCSPTDAEVCDGFDNDCNGEVDEGVKVTMYVDADGDHHGATGAASQLACADTDGLAASHDDCDDNEPEVFLGHAELCDELDNDCDDNVDDLCVCPSPNELCGTGGPGGGQICVNTDSSPLHCGGCGMPCTTAENCFDGSCSACGGEGQPCCAARGSTSDDGCPGDSLICTGARGTPTSVCGCPNDHMLCSRVGDDDICTNPATDNLNCGACGERCSSGETCVSGACEPSCPSGFTCTDLGVGGTKVCTQGPFPPACDGFGQCPSLPAATCSMNFCLRPCQ